MPTALPTEQALRVSPTEWMKRTSLTLGRRSAGLVKLDVAYANYWSIQGNVLFAGRLLDALEAYQKEVGGDWKKSERDKKSGGLIALTHARLLQEAKRKGWWKAGTGDKGASKLGTYDIPHSRYGVLFLLGNTTVTMDSWSVVLEGVSAVGGAVGTGLTTNMKHLDNVKLANPKVNIYGNDVAQSQVVSVGALLPKLGAKKIAEPAKKIAAKEFGVERTGSSFGFPCTRAGIEAIGEDPILFLNPFVLGATVVVGTGLLVADLLNNLRLLLMELVTKLYDFIKGKMMNDGAWPWDVGGMVVKKMIKFIVAKCLESAAPLIGGLMDVGTGLMKTFAAAKERIGAWLLRRKIQLSEGHPTLLANSIESEMSKGIFTGLWSVLKGVASLALQSFLPGAGNLVNAVVTGVEWLVKVVWRMWEESKLTKFLAEARTHLLREKALATAMPVQGRNPHGLEYEPNMDPTKGGIIHNLEAFKAFYKRGCDASPVIPMLTLNSGICGSLMTLLKMFDGREQTMVTQQTWNDGAEYFLRLKEFGRTYLTKSGFKFQSAHPSVATYLSHAISHHMRVKSTATKIISAAAAG